ncbi:MAG: UDP-glucose 4-epimerase [Bacteroidetes bacterium RIFOXYB2_FULL_35_7]|nr:MAG: UDP-glucose 4-epimerase [Bacteroidetes bacterium GWF2_35_48]OFY94641.1 MAG: UDP-glucose 4-epimerase [Bacteroidetes bacterium RIFOXYC12_FULL_35_7]OFY97439.1 MAG: UDP-glucose 4-epimerase [Bacteroidetes bacterium RIFOXYB2_FULL_35_7]HBX53523.1 UDP-glucose 4-epimerase [Bacteroidales bacterium]
MFENSTILVTGGTGSFGHQVVKRLLEEFHPKEIIIFSRDEKKQFDMRNLYKNLNLKFIIGDVRDRNSVFSAMKGVDYVFHAAALKQVPSCEFFPYEAVRTNIIGAENVLDAAEENNVKKVVVLSTDKAVYPINAMGISKAMMEKLMLAKARSSKSKTVFCGVRYGNVMYSRGSVIPYFIDLIKKDQPLTMTHPDMTRYLLPLPVAIELVLFALAHGENGDILVRKSPASTVKDLADAMVEIFNHKAGTKVIGIREGEKMHETLVTQEELMKSESYDLYYRVKNLSTIDYDKYFTEGSASEFTKEGYTSENTQRLSLQETKELVLSLEEIKEVLKIGI